MKIHFLTRPMSPIASPWGNFCLHTTALLGHLFRRSSLHAAVFFLFLLSPTLAQAASPVPPNVIVVLTDDQGYADLGVHGVRTDISTPNIDGLAETGVRFASAYAVAPQCVPARAGLLTGIYPQRFAVESNSTGPLPLDVPTISERLLHAGYKTGFVGKWHLEPNRLQHRWIEDNVPRPWNLNKHNQVEIPISLVASYFPRQRGFSDFFLGSTHSYLANFDLNGDELEPQAWLRFRSSYRIDVQTLAALAFIDRAAGKPFFLLLSYSAPHAPLEAPDAYLRKFTGIASDRRRLGLAMISAIDSGVGRVMRKLQNRSIDRDTLVIFISDHGAPIGADSQDLPISNPRGRWNGSLNEPWIGEKGTLLEGGIRVPFVMRWPNGLPSGVVYRAPVLSLDVAATVLAAAGLQADPGSDGIDLVPYLLGEKEGGPHSAIYWKWGQQAAVRLGDTKLLVLADGSTFLWDQTDETVFKAGSVTDSHTTARKALAELENWMCSLPSPGFDLAGAHSDSPLESKFLEFYLGYREPKSSSEAWSPACGTSEPR